jgi:putative sterol carrier protein
MSNSERAAMGWNSAPAHRQPSIQCDDPAETAKESVERRLTQRVKAHPELAHAGVGVCQLTILGEGGGTWMIDWTVEGGAVRPGKSERADCVVEVSAEDFGKLFDGGADPVELFYQGRLAIRGNVSMAMQLATLWEE